MAQQESPPNDRLSSYSAPALERGFNVLELLAGEPAGLTVSEIAQGLGLSISEVFRIIMVMERRQWLRKGTNDKYSVTPLMLNLAFRATPAEELTALATPVMRDFARATDQSCHLVIPNGGKGLILLRQQNPGPTGFHVRVGIELDLATTCSGRVLLAFNPFLQAVSDHGTPDADTGLNAIRQRGYERMESFRTLGVTDISFPIFDFHGDAAAALTMPFLRLIDGTQSVSLDEAQAHLSVAAKRITEQLPPR